ncbi:MAG: hypothetical protein ACQES9_06345 [Myxococcota bacterium]
MYKSVKTSIILVGLVFFAGCTLPRNNHHNNNHHYKNNNYQSPQEIEYETSSEPDIQSPPVEHEADNEDYNYPKTSSYPRKESTAYSNNLSTPVSKSEPHDFSKSENKHETQKLSNGSLTMVSKYSSKYDYSFFYPQGWYPQIKNRTLSIFKSKKDIDQFQYHIIFAKNPNASATSAKKYITLFLEKLAKRKGWNFRILNINKLSNKHKTAGLTFKTSNLKGFGLSLVKSDRVIFMIGFGKKTTYKQINAPIVLAYIFRSMIKGKTITTPVIKLKYLTNSLKLPPNYPKFLQKTAAKNHMGISKFWYSMSKIIPLSLFSHPCF